MKKKYMIIILVIIILLGGIYAFNNIHISTIKEANFDEEVSLRKNDILKIRGEEIYLTIKNFINSPPPPGTQAIWSGLDVIYELKIGDKVYTNSYETPYNVVIVKSDYKTYAIVKITVK